MTAYRVGLGVDAHALEPGVPLVLGGVERTRRVLRHFAPRQRRDGYFLSQEGEWDSNGEAIWTTRELQDSFSAALVGLIEAQHGRL